MTKETTNMVNMQDKQQRKGHFLVHYYPNTQILFYFIFLHEESAQHVRYMAEQRASSFHSSIVEME